MDYIAFYNLQQKRTSSSPINLKLKFSKTGSKTGLKKTPLIKASIPRIGVIIECPQNLLFHDACDIILMSQMAVREMVDHNHDHEQPITLQKDPFYQHFLEK